MAYKVYNANPLKKKTSDCVVRALCKVTDLDWDTVYKELFDIGYELKVMPNNDESWKEFLRRRGFIYHAIKVKKGSKRPRVNKFSRDNKGTFILGVANHIVACQGGHYYDTWDSGECCLYTYWEKPSE